MVRKKSKNKGNPHSKVIVADLIATVSLKFCPWFPTIPPLSLPTFKNVDRLITQTEIVRLYSVKLFTGQKGDACLTNDGCKGSLAVGWDFDGGGLWFSSPADGKVEVPFFEVERPTVIGATLGEDDS